MYQQDGSFPGGDTRGRTLTSAPMLSAPGEIVGQSCQITYQQDGLFSGGDTRGKHLPLPLCHPHHSFPIPSVGTHLCVDQGVLSSCSSTKLWLSPKLQKDAFFSWNNFAHGSLTHRENKMPFHMYKSRRTSRGSGPCRWGSTKSNSMQESKNQPFSTMVNTFKFNTEIWETCLNRKGTAAGAQCSSFQNPALAENVNFQRQSSVKSCSCSSLWLYFLLWLCRGCLGVDYWGLVLLTHWVLLPMFCWSINGLLFPPLLHIRVQVQRSTCERIQSSIQVVDDTRTEKNVMNRMHNQKSSSSVLDNNTGRVQ